MNVTTIISLVLTSSVSTSPMFSFGQFQIHTKFNLKNLRLRNFIGSTFFSNSISTLSVVSSEFTNFLSTPFIIHTNCDQISGKTYLGQRTHITTGVCSSFYQCLFQSCSTGVELNQSGGALITNGQLIANECTFTNCFSHYHGGAVFVNNSASEVTIISCHFISCTTGYGISLGNKYPIFSMGGGLYANTQGIVNLSNTIFEGCVCIGNTSYGGAVYSESSQLILFNTTFTGCGCQTPYPTQSTGGGLYAKQNIVSDASILNFTFTVFSDCSAYDGSFFYAENYNRMILNYTNITTSSSTSIPLSFISLNYNDLLITNPLLYIYALLLSAKNTNTKYISAQSSTSTLAQTFYENSFQSGTIGTIYLQEATTINGDIDFLPPLKTSDGSINFDFASNYPPLPISGGGSGEEATTSYEVTTSEIITLNESTFEESLNESTSNEDNGGGLSTAAIVCIVLACALFIGIIIAVVIVTLRNGSCARERSNDPFDVGIERRTNKQSTYF